MMIQGMRSPNLDKRRQCHCLRLISRLVMASTREDQVPLLRYYDKYGQALWLPNVDRRNT